METRAKILNSAQRLIQTRSFEGFSFQDIADEVGIRKASLYHHFDFQGRGRHRGAEAGSRLGHRAAGRDEGTRAPGAVGALFRSFPRPAREGRAYVPGRLFRVGVRRRVARRAAGAPRFTELHLDWLRRLRARGRSVGAFEIGEQAPRDVALQIFSSVQGALLTGRLTADQGVLDVVATELRTYLRYTPKGREGGSKPA